MRLSEYRLDELSSLAGVSIRNIRAYRERGLLDPPRRVGRSALYGDRHLAQLQAVNELLRKGFTSAHIAEFLDGTRQGHDLADILGLQQVLLGPSQRPAAAVHVDPASEEAQRLVRYGLAEVIDGEVTLVNPGIAEIVGRVTDQVPYVQTILRVSDGVVDLLEQLGAAVVAVLEQNSPQPGAAPTSSRTAADYRVLSRRVVADQLEATLQRHLAGGVADQAGN